MASVRFKKWLTENHLVPDRQRYHGGRMFGEMLRVANHWTHKIILYIAQTAMVAMMVIVFMTVVLRYVFDTGIGWAEEVPRLLVTLFAFIAAAIGVRDGMHISVRVVYNLFPQNGNMRKFLDWLSTFLVLLCGLFLLIFGYIYAKRLSMLTGELPMTKLPTFIQYLPPPIAGFVITFDSILFLTGVVKPEDLLYSEKEIDFMDEMLHKKKEDEEK